MGVMLCWSNRGRAATAAFLLTVNVTLDGLLKHGQQVFHTNNKEGNGFASSPHTFCASCHSSAGKGFFQFRENILKIGPIKDLDYGPSLFCSVCISTASDFLIMISTITTKKKSEHV